MWQYLFESWSWSIGGLIVGYILGRTQRTMHEIKKKVDEIGDQDDDDT